MNAIVYRIDDHMQIIVNMYMYAHNKQFTTSKLMRIMLYNGTTKI